MNRLNILAIESSCDETAAAVATELNGGPVLLSSVISSQIEIHKEFGGVVPEVAARAHIENIIPVVAEALRDAKLSLRDITHIAVTAGPGLIGSLVVGVETAKAIGISRDIPLIPLNHLEGHIYANFIREIKNEKLKIKNLEPEFPLVALLASGGHSMLIHMPKHLKYEVVGSTRDDAAGEAFDKAAKILGLGYPGGPAISKAAENGNPEKYNFPIIDLTPRPSRNKDGFLIKPEPSLDFSFSGLKTSLITWVKKITLDGRPLTKKEQCDLAASFQKAVVECLSQNVLRAIEKYQPKTFILSGGVAANNLLRETLADRIAEKYPKTAYLIPESILCTDNAAMIASAAYYHIQTLKLQTKSSANFSAEPNMKL